MAPTRFFGRMLLKAVSHALSRACGGNSAIEFGLIAPILLAMLVGLVDVGKIAYDRTNMHGAARAGGQYFMAGGQNLQRAHEIINASWAPIPKDASVTLDRFCLCQTTESICTALCPNDEAPDVFVRIRMAVMLKGTFLKYNTQASETVRIR